MKHPFDDEKLLILMEAAQMLLEDPEQKNKLGEHLDVSDEVLNDLAFELCLFLESDPPKKPEPWAEDSRFTRQDWKDEVHGNATNLGYWEWVDAMRERRGR
jgi:hypothetical protein